MPWRTVNRIEHGAQCCWNRTRTQQGTYTTGHSAVWCAVLSLKIQETARRRKARTRARAQREHVRERESKRAREREGGRGSRTVKIELVDDFFGAQLTVTIGVDALVLSNSTARHQTAAISIVCRRQAASTPLRRQGCPHVGDLTLVPFGQTTTCKHSTAASRHWSTLSTGSSR